MDGVRLGKNKLGKIVLLVMIAVGTLALVARRRAPHPLRVGESAVDFVLPTLGQGPIALRDYRQQVVILNFWATWCPPCVEETPSLETFAAEVRNHGVVVIGVSVDEDPAALAKFSSAFHLSFPIARDPNRALASRYGTFQFPESYIIDRSGRVAEKIIGPIDWQDPRVLSFVAELARAGGSTMPAP